MQVFKIIMISEIAIFNTNNAIQIKMHELIFETAMLLFEFLTIIKAIDKF